MSSEPKIYKIEGEAFKRIFDLRKKQEEIIKAARAGEAALNEAIFKEIGIVPGTIGNSLMFDDQYEATGTYFLRELPLNPIAAIVRAMQGAANSELCPDCGSPHEAGDVTKH